MNAVSSSPAVVTFGETMALMRADQPGSLAHVAGMSVGIGGAESNVAVALQRLGVSVAWIGRVGADSLGDRIVRELRGEGIQVVPISDPGAPTGLMLKERRTTDSVRVWYYRSGSAGSRLAPADLPTELIEGARVLHVTGITPALSASAAAATHHAVDRAKDAGVLVSFDLNYRSALWSPETAAPELRRLAAKADIVFAGDDEAAIAVGAANDPDILLTRLAELGPREVVLKRGSKGSMCVVDGIRSSADAVRIRPTDTVGAGDAFVAGYLSAMLRDEAAPERLALANRVGAFACMVPGDWEGAPRPHELRLLDDGDPVAR